MDCTDLNALLSGFVDDEIPPDRRHAAERHLVGCATCRALVARAESLDAAVRSAASEWAADGAFPDRCVRAVLDRTVGNQFILRRARRLAGMGWLAAAAALTFAVVVWTIRPDTPPRFDSSTSMPTSSFPGGTSAAPGVVSQPKRPGDAPTVLAAGGAVQTDPRRETRGSSGGPTGSHLPECDSSVTVPSTGCAGPDDREYAVAALMGPPSCLALVDEHGAALCDGRKERDPFERGLDPMSPELAAEASQVLFASALLLSRVASASPVGFDAERDPVATIVEYDALADRLAQIRCHLRRGVDRAAVWATEAMLLRLRERPLDDAERQEMREDIIRMRLIEILDATSRRIDSLPRA